jgi:predicted nucleic acid-binding protein
VIFLDTNVISEPVRPKADQRVVAWIAANKGKLALSTVVLAEIAFGIERVRPDQRAKRLEGFLAQTRSHFAGRLHGFDEESAIIYGMIMGQALRKGRAFTVPDGMIAAITLRHSATLATRNMADFEFLKIKLVNPWA